MGTPAEVVTGHLVFFGASIGFAALAWRFVETPARRLMLAASHTTWRIGVAALVIVAVGMAAFGIDYRRHPRFVIAGNFQHMLGCPRDWVPACDQTRMRLVRGSELEADSQIYALTLPLPAGRWEMKLAEGGGWEGAIGVGGRGGPNLTLELHEPTRVEVRYARGSGWLTTSATAPFVTLSGSFQRALGCPTDWSPDCLATWMQDPDGDGVYAWETRALDSGRHVAKVTLGGTWTTNYGAEGVADGPNVDFDVPGQGALLRFRWDMRTHRLTDTQP